MLQRVRRAPASSSRAASREGQPSQRAEVIAEEVDLHLLAREVELRIRDHVRRRWRDHLGALAREIERLSASVLTEPVLVSSS